MFEMERLEVYVDGSVSKGNGGVSVRVLSIDSDGNEIPYDFQSGNYPNARSGQMEITACSYALRIARDNQLIHHKKQVIIFTDSKYVKNNYKDAMFYWVKNNWCSKDGRPVADATEWKQLVKLFLDYKKIGVFVEIDWIKGHSINKHNNAVHRMAKKLASLPVEKQSKNSILSIYRPEILPLPRRMELGSVKMEGQKISIKILDIEYLTVQKLWSCKYLVLTKTSAYHGLVDKIFSNISLDIGRKYYVKFNTNKKNPKIEKVYRKIY